MKKIFLYTLVTSLLWMSACDGFIDLKPTHQLDRSNTFQNIDDYNNALTGAYGALLLGGYYGQNYLCMPEYMTDNLARTVELFSGQDDTDNWLATPSAGRITDAWNDPYVVINRANTVIGNIAGVAETIPGQRNRILGQALGLRALAHFDLLRFFGQEYGRNSTALGVIVRTQNDLTYPARKTVKETYDQIFADLDEAFTLLSNVDQTINISTNRYYIDRIVVRALISRVALYSGDYALARDAANDVITTSGFSLAPRSQFSDIWTADQTLGEVIWKVRVQPGGVRIAADLFFPPGNFNTFAPTDEVRALFDEINDVRYNVSIKTRATAPAGSSLFIVGKYLGRAPLADGVNDNKVLRIGEMYLIRAEANARIPGQEAAALADLNALRAARITGYVNQNLSGNTLLNSILLEKRKELLFEGHRWFELRRLGQGITRTECRPPCISSVLPASSPRFVLPIPQSEVTSNVNVVQNPGY